MLSDFFGKGLSGFLRGQICSCLSRPICAQAVNVDVSSLELVGQFSKENCHADAVERDDEDLVAVRQLPKPCAVKTIVQKFP